MRIQLPQAVGGKGDGSDRDFAVRKKRDVVEPPIGGQDLILRSYRLFEKFLLDINALYSQLFLADHLTL